MFPLLFRVLHHPEGTAITLPGQGPLQNSARLELLTATIALELPHTLCIKSDSLNTVRKAQLIIQGKFDRLMPVDEDAPHRHDRLTNGDAWHQLHQRLKHRSPSTIQFVWTRGHTTDEHVAVGESTAYDRNRNAHSDAHAKAASKQHGPAFIIP